MDRMTAIITAMHVLREARACICRAEIAKERKEEKEWLLKEALHHLDRVASIMQVSSLTPRDIGTKVCELIRLRAMAMGQKTFSIPAPRPEYTAGIPWR